MKKTVSILAGVLVMSAYTGVAKAEVASTGWVEERIQALDAPDTAEAGKFVTAVAEEDGMISVSRSTITWDDIDGEFPFTPDGQVQADWNEDNSANPGYIMNKPGTTSTVTQNSRSLITSGGVWSAIDDLDVSDTAADREYVNQVTETDGKITVSRVALPSVTDAAVTGQYVSAVSEDKGQIAVTRASLPDVTDAAVTGQYVSAVSQDKGKITVTRAQLPSVANSIGQGEYITSLSQNDGAITYSVATLPGADFSGLVYNDTAVTGEYVSKVDEADGIISVTRTALPSVTDTAVPGKYVSSVTQDKGKITVNREDLPEADFSGLSYEDTAVTGEYVSKVNEADGIISVTRTALPSALDTVVPGQFVTSVSQDKGQITVTRASITGMPECNDDEVAIYKNNAWTCEKVARTYTSPGAPTRG